MGPMVEDVAAAIREGAAAALNYNASLTSEMVIRADPVFWAAACVMKLYETRYLDGDTK